MKDSQRKAMFAKKEMIPQISTYAEGYDSGKGDLEIDKVTPLMKKLNEAWELAGNGADVKFGDTDEADAISSVISGIQKKYQDRATQLERGRWT